MEQQNQEPLYEYSPIHKENESTFFIVAGIFLAMIVAGVMLTMAGNHGQQSAAQGNNNVPPAANTATPTAPDNSNTAAEPAASQPPAVTTPSHESTPPTPPSNSSAMNGERFPQTRTRQLALADISNWNYGKTRYALNEMYARYGYPFHSGPIRKQFDQFSWYHPVAGRSTAEIEDMMTPVEKANLQLLAQRRSQLQSH